MLRQIDQPNHRNDKRKSFRQPAIQLRRIRVSLQKSRNPGENKANRAIRLHRDKSRMNPLEKLDIKNPPRKSNHADATSDERTNPTQTLPFAGLALHSSR
jgi:hypothetical protein